MTSVRSEVREAKQYIAGEWTDASGGGTFEDLDPFTGDVVALVPAGSRDDAARAAAAAAFPEWSQSPPAQRQAIFELTELRWITVQGGAGHPYPF